MLAASIIGSSFQRPQRSLPSLGPARGAGGSLVLSPGDFLVVFPDDAHKIKMRVDGRATVSKAVFKIKINE